MFAPQDPNIDAFNKFKSRWKNAVVTSGLIAPAYFPYFDTFANQVSAPNANISEQDFDTKINELAAKIKAFYAGAQYRGNLAELSNQIDLSKPKWTDPAALTDPNYLKFITFRNQWKNNAVASGQIDAKFFPFYDVIVGAVAPPRAGLTAAQFSTKMDELVGAIKRFYAASEYKGNLAVLSNTIDQSRPDRVTVPTPAAPSVPQATTPQGLSQEVIINSQKFFKNTGGIKPAVDYSAIFEDLRALTNSDQMDIEGLLSGTAPGAALKTLETKVDGEIASLEEKVKVKQAKVDALNQQFVDERSITGKVDKPKVMVLQDWILAGFAIAYLFFAVVAVLYVSSKSVYPGRAAAAMITLMVVATAVMYTWISYLA